MSDAQKSAALNTIFGSDAIRAALILAQEGTQGYTDMAAAVNEQGAAAAMAGAQNSGLAGAMEQISGSLESLGTKIALPFLDTIAGKVGELTAFINTLGELPQPVINAGLAFAGFAAAIGLALVAAAGIAGVIGALATPIGLVVLVVLGLAAAVAALWLAWETNWNDIQGKTAAVLAVIQPLIETLSSTLSGIGSSLSTFKMPTLADLDTLKSDIEFQIKATVETLLDPPKLTIMPFPDMTIDPPKVTIKPIPQQTIQGAAKGATDMLHGLNETIAGADWAGAGHLMATLIVTAWNTEVAKIKPFLTLVGIAGAFSQAILGLQGAMIGALVSLGLALQASGVGDEIAALGKNIYTALKTMWTTLMADIMGLFIAPAPDATSLSDTLRDRNAAAETPALDWDSFITPLAWADWLSPLSWASWISSFEWGTFIANITWASFVPTVSWSSFVSDISWASFIPFLDWGRFIPAFAPPSGASPGGPPQRDTDPNANVGFVTAGASFATASYGGGSGGGPTIVIQNVNVHNDMDIEVLAGKLARRFQQKLR